MSQNRDTMKLPTNKKAEILARESGARGCIITLYFGDHNHVALWFDKPIGKVNRADMIDMVDDVLSGTEELEKKIEPITYEHYRK